MKLGAIFAVWHGVEGAYDNNSAFLHLLLTFTRDSSATDPRDKIYGLLGIMN